MDQRKNYRQYLKCPEKDIPKRSCRRYRNEDPSTECDLSFGTNLGTTEVDSESSVEGDQSLEEEKKVFIVEDLEESMESESSNSESESEEEEMDISTEQSTNEQDTPLYEGAPITVSASYLMLFYYAKKFNLTLEGFQGLLDLVKCHCPPSNKCASSVYKLKNYFNKLFGNETRQILRYCAVCCTVLTDGVDCGCRGQGVKPVEFFCGDLTPQLKKLLEDPEISRHILKDRRRPNDGKLRDIYDGSEYQRQVQHGFLDNPNNISLSLNTDGVAIFRSSKKGELWPLYLVINELPPKMRMSPRTMITCGLWCAPGKPNMQIYLRPLIDEINIMHQQGFMVETDLGPVRCKAMLLLSTDDLPARALLTNMKNCNGKSSCSTCHQKGKTMPGNVLHRVWPFEDDNQLRTREDVLWAVREVDRTKSPCQGIKGASVLLLHPPFDIVKGFVVDYMHTVLLGVVPALLDLWLSKDNKDKPYFIGNKLDMLNKRLMSIKVPDCIKRVPRKLDDRQHWKANEFRAWLLHYSIPVLSGILPSMYLNHYAMLVWAMFTLLGEEIDQGDVDKSQTLLDDFAQSLPTMYSEKTMTMKVHELRHIALFVKAFGPLWVFSCFPYENTNGHLKGLVHGTRYIASQISFTQGMVRHRSDIQRHIQQQQLPPETLAFVNKMAGNKERSNVTAVEEGIEVLGAETKKTLSVHERMALNLFLSTRGLEMVHEGEEVSTFLRVQKDGQVFHSTEYTRVTARNSFTIKFKNPCERDHLSYGQVLRYVRRGALLIAILKLLREYREPILTSHMTHSHLPMAIKVELSSNIIAIDVSSIERKCVFVNTGVDNFVSNIPNFIECD